jgi:hypothetical protein
MIDIFEFCFLFLSLRLVLNTDIGLDEEEIKPPENWSIPDWKNLSEHVVVVPGSIFTGICL